MIQQKKFHAHDIKCGLYLSFWPKLMNKYLFTKFYCSFPFLAKADLDWFKLMLAKVFNKASKGKNKTIE